MGMHVDPCFTFCFIVYTVMRAFVSENCGIL